MKPVAAGSYRPCRYYQVEALVVLAMAARGECLVTVLNPVATSVARVKAAA